MPKATYRASMRGLEDAGAAAYFRRLNPAASPGQASLLDYKSTPQGSAQWPEVAHQHAGQMLAYGALLEAASGLPVLETWLVLPVAAAALRLAFFRSDSVCF